MIKIKFILLIILLVSFMSFSACFPTEPTSASSNRLLLNEQPPEVLKVGLLHNLSVNAKVICDSKDNWKKIAVEYKNFDREDYLKLFIKEKEIIDEYNSDSSIVIGQKAHIYNFDDESSLNIDCGQILYLTMDYMERTYDNVIHTPGTGNYIRDDLDLIYKKTDLERIDKNEAVKAFSSIVEKLGISTHKEPKVYVLDYNTLMQEWEDFNLKDGTPAPKWNKSDEAYLIEFEEDADGLPISKYGYIDPEKGIPLNGGRIFGVVSEEGLLSFSCSGIFDTTGYSEDVDVVSLNVALNSIKAKFENIILTDPIEITEISLKLLPVCVNANTYQINLVPVWTFQATQSVEKITQKIKYSIFINGITGDEIITGGMV